MMGLAYTAKYFNGDEWDDVRYYRECLLPNNRRRRAEVAARIRKFRNSVAFDEGMQKNVHEVNTVGIWDKLLAETFDSDREGSTKEANLMLLIAVVDNLFQNWLEFWRKEFISLVHDDCTTLRQVCHLTRCQI